MFLGLVWRNIARLGRTRCVASSSNEVGVVPVIEEQMSSGLRDLSDDASEKLERVDFFEPREKLTRVVV